MPVLHKGSSSVLDLMPSTRVNPDPQKVERAQNRESARKSADAVVSFGARTPDEAALLKVLRTDGPVDDVAALAHATGLGHTSISTALSDLEARGQVRRRGHGYAGSGPKIEAV